MLDLQKSDNDLNILVNGKTIEKSLEDLQGNSRVGKAIVLKTMNTHFL